VSISRSETCLPGDAGRDPLKTLSFTGDIRCRAIRAGDFTLTDVAMKVMGAKGVIDVSQASEAVLGGSGSGTLHADFTGPSLDSGSCFP